MDIVLSGDLPCCEISMYADESLLKKLSALKLKLAGTPELTTLSPLLNKFPTFIRNLQSSMTGMSIINLLHLLDRIKIADNERSAE